jgi:ankyrin repeat protein
MSRSRKHRLLITGLLLTLFVLLHVWAVWQAVRQEHRNQGLIAAIYRNDTTDVLSLLAAGADANATANGSEPIAIRQILTGFWHRWRHDKTEETFHAPALLVLFQFVRDPPDALKWHPENIAILQAMLDHGADANARYEDGETVLIHACTWYSHRTVQLLVEHGADVNLAYGGSPPLSFATTIANVQTVAYLLDHGAHIDTEDESGDTAIMWAAFDDKKETFRLLLNRGADINHQNKSGHTALMLAIINGHLNYVKPLLQRGAKVGIRDEVGKTALQWAREDYHPDIIRLLQKAGAKQ